MKGAAPLVVTAISFALCLYVGTFPYLQAASKTNRGWNDVPDFPRAFVVEHTLATATPGLLAIIIGATILGGARRRLLGFGILALAPFLSLISCFAWLSLR